MDSFLGTLASDLKGRYDDLSSLAVVFPTRRAGLFFRNELSRQADGPKWSPAIYSIQDFLCRLAGRIPADPVTLVFELYDAYRQSFPEESFDKFYAWGEILLKDFDDIDKYLADPKQIFTLISDIHEIEQQFNLPEDELERLREFWKNFFDREPSSLRNNFRNTWKELYPVYERFRERLSEKNLWYEGMIYRDLAESIKSAPPPSEYTSIVFAGLYALTPSESAVIESFLSRGMAEAVWDTDAYYADDRKQEAGKFFRNNPLFDEKKHRHGNFFSTMERDIEIAGVPLIVGQAKYAGQVLTELMEKPDFVPEKTALVLPDESLLFPLLYSLPGGDINVTMGYPLRHAPVYTLFDHLASLHRNARMDKNGEPTFYIRDVQAVTGHTYIRPAGSHLLLKDATRMIRIPRAELVKTGIDLFNQLFTLPGKPAEILSWLGEIMKQILASMMDGPQKQSPIETEFIYHFYTQVNRLGDILSERDEDLTAETVWTILREVLGAVKIPFSGEPVKGLQVMGFLETRVIDFENLIVLSMNEEVIPSGSNKPSFIPYNLRKAFHLPTYEDQHAVAAYHFYRMLQRAKKVCLIHNTESKAITTGEKSRFLLQIEHELTNRFPGKVRLRKTIVSTQLRQENTAEIRIEKTPEILADLERYFYKADTAPSSQLSASGLQAYISCPLKFYFRYVAGLSELEDEDENMDAATFGKILHKAMQLLYTGIEELSEDILPHLQARVDDVVDQAIHEEFVSIDQLEGKNILLRNVIRKLVHRILVNEKASLPVRILQLEKDVSQPFSIDGARQVKLYGIIDRVDELNGVTRVIDYKTGKVFRKAPDQITALFEDPKYKEQFQAMYYAMLTRNRMPGRTILPGLITLREMGEGIWFLNEGKAISEDQFDEYSILLKELLTKIFSPEIPFTQTEDQNRCGYCAYNETCGRSRL